MEKTLGYHFTDGMKLRDGQELIEGKTYVHKGPIEICRSGLHASRRVIDALRYAPNGTLSIVECSGIEEKHIDKFVCRERKVLETHDVTRLLQDFALDIAEEVVEKYWNDTRALDVIRVSRLYLDGKASFDELKEARKAGYYDADAHSYHHSYNAGYYTARSVYSASDIVNAYNPYNAYNAACFTSAANNKPFHEYNTRLTLRLQKVFKTSLDF